MLFQIYFLVSTHDKSSGPRFYVNHSAVDLTSAQNIGPTKTVTNDTMPSRAYSYCGSDLLATIKVRCWRVHNIKLPGGPHPLQEHSHSLFILSDSLSNELPERFCVVLLAEQPVPTMASNNVNGLDGYSEAKPSDAVIKELKSQVKGEIIVKGDASEVDYKAAIHRWNEGFIQEAVSRTPLACLLRPFLRVYTGSHCVR